MIQIQAAIIYVMPSPTFALRGAGDQLQLSVHPVVPLDEAGDGVVEVVLEHDLPRAVVARVQFPVAPAGDQFLDTVAILGGSIEKEKFF